ncbi:MAG: hypothetical protein QME05_04775 [Candidatus Margulisbacteria bacterium]|nr:hypothetical protein [Candidatus Margulisiibacteriota bacterium]
MAQVQNKPQGPNLEILGFKNPMEIIDLLALLRIDGEPIVKDDQAVLDPKLKAKTVVEYFQTKFNLNPNDLPYLASLIKKDIKQKRMK